ncbi:hypothetical protein [Sulfobacillus thermosulfidooxidans]|uniref:hypothetical protein n=1 Tax=Sulfobacillus thermosulfidooxidans TaxID=28034 RepID=UPI0003093D0E|nr:hypothetical protein [Sulfobacillus thermosulfidooxidans]
MVSSPLLPLNQKGLTRREAADCLRGLAELIETYPAEGVVLTVNVEAAITGQSAPQSRSTKSRR